MIRLPRNIIYFFEQQRFVIVSTLDHKDKIHSSAKGIVGIEETGRVYLIDLYQANTFNNLKRNPTISITAIDEHQFIGYTLKGKAEIVQKSEIGETVMRNWYDRVVQRISQRVVKNIKEDKINSQQPEAFFPHPQYLIKMNVEEIVDLTPGHLKRHIKANKNNKS